MRDERITKFPFGGDYNPKQWDPETWPEDMKLLREAGVDTVTINVFSWALIQKDDDVYDFSILDSIVRTVTDAGMNICMATATAAVPAWMSRKHPDIRRVEWNGMRHTFGGRENACPNSPTMRKYSPLMARKLAERYASLPNIIAWHVSNEYSGRCYCENCTKAFREWLRDKYGTIEKLNHEWNANFWGHTFYDWDDIVAPNILSEEFGDYWNARTCFQGISLDYARFQSDSLLRNYRDEYDEIKKVIPDALVTTNLMGAYKEINYQKWAPYLDIAAHDNYPWDGESESSVGFTLDLIRGLKGGRSWWLMEQTPSVSNWFVNCSVKRPGVMRLLSYQAVAHGADSVMFFQMKRSVGACEKYHGAVIDHVGHGETRVYREVQTVGKELERLGDQLLETVTPAKYAILFDWDNWWAVEYSAGPSAYLKYADEVKKYYEAMHRLHISVDIISYDSDISGYDTVFAPLMYMIKPGMADKLEKYVQNGGHFVTTAFSGYVNENDRVTVGGYPGELKKLMGIWVEEIDALPQDKENHFRLFDKDYPARIVCDVIHTQGAVALADYKEDFYAGSPVITCNSFGRGRAYYIGTSSSIEFYMDLMLKELGMEGIEFAESGTVPCAYRQDYDSVKYVESTVRENDSARFFFYLNHSEEVKRVIAPSKGIDILTDREYSGGDEIELAGYGVVILRTSKA